MSRIGGIISAGNTDIVPAGISHVEVENKFIGNCGALLVNVATEAIDKITKNLILIYFLLKKSHSFSAVLLANESWISLITFQEIVQPFIHNNCQDILTAITFVSKWIHLCKYYSNMVHTL